MVLGTVEDLEASYFFFFLEFTVLKHGSAFFFFFFSLQRADLSVFVQFAKPLYIGAH